MATGDAVFSVLEAVVGVLMLFAAVSSLRRWRAVRAGGPQGPRGEDQARLLLLGILFLVGGGCLVASSILLVMRLV